MEVQRETVDINEVTFFIHLFQRELSQSERQGKILVEKLREVADDLEGIWTKFRYLRLGTTGVKTVSGALSVAGGVCLLVSSGPVGPLIALGTGGLVLGSVSSYCAAKLEEYLNSKKFEELKELMELNCNLMLNIQEKLNTICNLDFQTLQAIVRTADRLVKSDQSISPLIQLVKYLITNGHLTPSTPCMQEVQSLFGMVDKTDDLLHQFSGATVPLEFASLASGGAKANKRSSVKSGSGYSKFGGVLLIVTGMVSVFVSGQELVELIKNHKFEAADLLRAKAKDIEANLRPFDCLKD